jgi:hypothetical protein
VLADLRNVLYGIASGFASKCPSGNNGVSCVVVCPSMQVVEVDVHMPHHVWVGQVRCACACVVRCVHVLCVVCAVCVVHVYVYVYMVGLSNYCICLWLQVAVEPMSSYI